MLGASGNGSKKKKRVNRRRIQIKNKHVKNDIIIIYKRTLRIQTINLIKMLLKVEHPVLHHEAGHPVILYES